ncbi:hypothetical protein EDD86DRAFT_201362 [Gorgonomyces haynaldii]|nr:hypothetical protein EDD86DRAFT_201362 [Gorgonomyces haynaldii]
MEQSKLIVDTALQVWKQYFRPQSDDVSESKSIDTWNYCTMLKSQTPESHVYQITLCQPTQEHPVASATGSIWFTISLRDDQYFIQYRYEHHTFVHSLLVDAHLRNLKETLEKQAKLLGNPLKRISEIIRSKNQNAQDPHIRGLFPVPESVRYTLKEGPVKYTPLPIVKYGPEDSALLMSRGHTDKTLPVQ